MISDARSFSSLMPTESFLWLLIAIIYSHSGYEGNKSSSDCFRPSLGKRSPILQEASARHNRPTRTLVMSPVHEKARRRVLRVLRALLYAPYGRPQRASR